MDWQYLVIKIMTAPTDDLRELARIAGKDPRTFYRDANFRKADLSRQDLDGIDLTNADTSRALMPDDVFAHLEDITAELMPHLTPRQRAELNFARGNDFYNRGMSRSGELWFERSERAYRRALDETPISEFPDFWANIEYRIGLSLWRQGVEERGVSQLGLARDSLQASLHVLSTLENNERLEAKQEGSTGVLDESAGRQENETGQGREQIIPEVPWEELFEGAQVPAKRGVVQLAMGHVLLSSGSITGSEVSLREAIDVFEQVVITDLKQIGHLVLAKAFQGIGEAALQLASGETRMLTQLDKSISSFRHAVDAYEMGLHEVGMAVSLRYLGDALLLKGRKKRSAPLLREAASCFDEARKMLRNLDMPANCAAADFGLAVADFEVASRRRAAGDTFRQHITDWVELEAKFRSQDYSFYADQLAAMIPRATALIARLSVEEAPDSAPQKE